MGETSIDDVESYQESASVPGEDAKYHVQDMATPDVPNTAMKIERAREIYESAYTDIVVKPTNEEVWIWYLYELCSYFINNTLVPVLFPLIISQILKLPPEPARGWDLSRKGLSCSQKETKLYEALTHRSISVNNSKFSPLEWTCFSWGIGLLLAAPIVASISTHLDHGRSQILITGAAIAIGAFFCLPSGFFNVTWIFPPYIAAIVAASIVATASHTRQLGLMVRGFTGPALQKNQFPIRRAVSSWLSLYATAAGGIGSAIISTFIYHMLKHGEKFISLWVVSIFSGLKWLAGLSHVYFIKPGAAKTLSVSSIAHFLSIFKYPHALGTLVVAFLSSFTTMCIFTGAVLYLIGELCFKPVFILSCWLTYFIFPVVSLPLMHPIQLAIKANAVRMHLLGFYLSIVTAAFGFYFRSKIWHKGHVLVLVGLQSTSVGLLHAFGRVLLIDCSPSGKEGAFSAWFSWCKALGTCAGFAVASAIPGNVSTSFGIAFLTAISGVILLNYGNISDFRGAIAAGHMSDEEDG
ncbi:hypothetical protein P3X46_032233 [Hevea brasiliensis]|uniref:Major facilitator superfamily (MFS) profile domain-containing protein n=1 Tax=Hevea brasiliensis TaxID=3981 RepID=A0ABQ9KE58_HEVBR|nr:hypothetical protein P3X46_032233 [Hevea brasiliensis]